MNRERKLPPGFPYAYPRMMMNAPEICEAVLTADHVIASARGTQYAEIAARMLLEEVSDDDLMPEFTSNLAWVLVNTIKAKMTKRNMRKRMKYPTHTFNIIMSLTKLYLQEAAQQREMKEMLRGLDDWYRASHK